MLGTAALMLGVYTIVGAAGESAFRTLVLAAVVVVLLALFVLRQARARDPLLPLRLFSSRTLTGANLVQLLTVAAAFGFQFHRALPAAGARVLRRADRGGDAAGGARARRRVAGGVRAGDAPVRRTRRARDRARAAREEDSGLASGLFSTTQQIASALGLAVLAVVAASHTGSPEALTCGYRLAFTVGTGLAVAAVAVAAFVLVPRRGGETS